MIGMAEVSSVDFDDLQRFEKGQEIGRFHFGGSTHCLVFGAGVKFSPDIIAVPKDSSHAELDPVPVCRGLGVFSPVFRQQGAGSVISAS